MCQCCRWPLPGSISIDCEDGRSFRHCGECHVVCTHALDLLLIELASDRPGGRWIHRTFDPRRSISHACACTRRMSFSFTLPLSRWLLFFFLLLVFSSSHILLSVPFDVLDRFLGGPSSSSLALVAPSCSHASSRRASRRLHGRFRHVHGQGSPWFPSPTLRVNSMRKKQRQSKRRGRGRRNRERV